MTRNIALSLVAASLLLTGCPGLTTLPPKGEVTTNAPLATVAPIIRSLNITGAKSLFLAGLQQAAAGYRIAASENAGGIFRLNADNTVEQVKPKDASGSTIAEGFTPDYLSGVNAGYVYLSVKEHGSFIIRKSDGKVAKIDDKAITGIKSSLAPVQSDKNGNLYYAFGGKLVKIQTGSVASYNTSSIGFHIQADEVIKTELSGSQETTDPELAVDREGNALVGLTSSSGQHVIRLYKANGGAENIGIVQEAKSGSSVAPVPAWVGHDGFLYVSANNTDTSGVTRLKISASGTVLREAINVPWGVRYPYAVAVSSNRTVLYMGKNSVWSEIVVLGEDEMPDNYGLMAAAHYHLTKVADVTSLKASATAAYALGPTASGGTAISRLDLTTHVETSVVTDTDYQIFNFAVTPDDQVTVSALRLSDNTYVVGKVDDTGHLTVLDSTLPQVQQVLPLE